MINSMFFDELYKQYPKCKSALEWWCNTKPSPSHNIKQNKLLKEFMIKNPPKFKISQDCCKYAKKDLAHDKLKEGYDFVQGSRFIKGGHAVRTPFIRLLSVRLLHAPVISLTAHFHFTDTTNAYRAYSRNYLTHPKVLPLRDIFMTYELLAYLSVRATQLGLRACEIPVDRVYPKSGKTPTKISFVKGNSELLKILFKNLKGDYKPVHED